MTYQEQADQLADEQLRARITVCATEQAHIYTAGEPSPSATLADAVIASNWTALQALAAAVIVSPNGPNLGNDPDLLAAMQAVWAATADALYPAGGPTADLAAQVADLADDLAAVKEALAGLG